MNVGFVTYPVSDLSRAIAFYRDVCGFPGGESLSSNWYEFDLDGIGFALVTNAEEMGITPGSQFTLGVEVGDLEPIRAKLAAAGIEPHTWNSPRCDALFIADPDGNRLAFHHLKDESIKNQ